MSDPIFSSDEADRSVLKRVEVRVVTSDKERARWDALGQTAGFERVAEDFYVAHERPKQLWVKALEWEGRGWLRAEFLPPALAEQLTALIPMCRMKAPVVGSLWERFHHYLPDQRS